EGHRPVDVRPFDERLGHNADERDEDDRGERRTYRPPEGIAPRDHQDRNDDEAAADPEERGGEARDEPQRRKREAFDRGGILSHSADTNRTDRLPQRARRGRGPANVPRPGHATFGARDRLYNVGGGAPPAEPWPLRPFVRSPLRPALVQNSRPFRSAGGETSCRAPRSARSPIARSTPSS